MRSGVLLIVAGLVLGMCLAPTLGCGDSGPTGPPPEAPELPRSEAWDFSVRFFEENYVPPSAPGIFATAHGAHFGNGAVRALNMGNLPQYVIAGMNRAMDAAGEVEPRWDGGGHVWEFTVLEFGNSIQVRLRGVIVEDGVDWKAERLAPAHTAGVWFSGTRFAQPDSLTDHGTWTVHHPDIPGVPEVLVMEWDVFNALHRQVAFEFTQDGAGKNGDRLIADYDDYEVRFDFTDASEDDRPTVIQWNAESRSGSVHASDYWRGQEACWNWALADVFCRFGGGGGETVNGTDD